MQSESYTKCIYDLGILELSIDVFYFNLLGNEIDILLEFGKKIMQKSEKNKYK